MIEPGEPQWFDVTVYNQNAVNLGYKHHFKCENMQLIHKIFVAVLNVCCTSSVCVLSNAYV